MKDGKIKRTLRLFAEFMNKTDEKTTQALFDEVEKESMHTMSLNEYVKSLETNNTKNKNK